MSALVDLATLIDDIGCTSYTLHATDSTYYAARNPNTEPGRPLFRLTIIGRTEFQHLCQRLNAHVTERIVNPGQRGWWAVSDTNDHKLLIEGVSFQHHEDWEPKP